MDIRRGGRSASSSYIELACAPIGMVEDIQSSKHAWKRESPIVSLTESPPLELLTAGEERYTSRLDESWVSKHVFTH